MILRKSLMEKCVMSIIKTITGNRYYYQKHSKNRKRADVICNNIKYS